MSSYKNSFYKLVILNNYLYGTAVPVVQYLLVFELFLHCYVGTGYQLINPQKFGQ